MKFIRLSRLPSSPTIFPYTTLFRSDQAHRPRGSHQAAAGEDSFDGHFPTRQTTGREYRGGDSPERQGRQPARSEEHTSELQSHHDLVCRILLENRNTNTETAELSR